MKISCLLLSLVLPLLAHSQALPPAATHAANVAEFQRQLNREFSDPAESPLSATERVAFRELPFYPVAYGYCVAARLVRDSTAVTFAMPVSLGQPHQYRKYGTLHFALDGQPRQLAVYQSLALLQKPGYADYLFVPFTDLTNGHGSYHGGRYLDLRIPAPGVAEVVLDFNRAYNPSCAYSARYACPIPPAENRLPIAIEVGVRSDH